MKMQLSCGCCDGIDVTMRSVYRYINVVGPQAPVGFEDSSWTLSSFLGGSSYMVFFDRDAEPTYTVPEAPYNHWVRRMAPMRFQIDDLVGWNGYTIGHREIRQLFESLEPIVGHSSVLLPANSHMSPGRMTHVSFPTRGFRHWSYSTGSGWSTSVSVTHYRILIDGVDVTGVVSLGGGIPLNFPVSPGTSYVSGSATAFVPIPPAAHTAKSVMVDFWVYLDTLGGPFDIGVADYPLCEVDPGPVFDRAEFKSADVNQRRRSSDKYRLTFSSGGPAASLIMESAAGWTFQSTTTSQTLRNSSWVIDLDWSREYAWLLLTDRSKNNIPTNAGSSMRYFASNSGDYAGVQFRNTNIIRPGVWNPRGSTTFGIRQRSVAPAYGHPHQFITEGGAPETAGSWPSNLFDGFPETITVEKV